jgi:predicted PhzF superfamily epimerase YddE/YHI9
VNARIFQVDAFSAQPFGGNPAGVCLLADPAPDVWMQAVAAEMNLSETAFLRGREEGFDVRYFTPLVEVPLCGHATLASAHLLWEEGLAPPGEPISVHAPAGLLTARREHDWICLDFPAYPVSEVPVPVGLADALGAAPRSAHRRRQGGYLLEFDTATTVRALRPDFALLRAQRAGGVIVTAPATSQVSTLCHAFSPPRWASMRTR